MENVCSSYSAGTTGDWTQTPGGCHFSARIPYLHHIWALSITHRTSRKVMVIRVSPRPGDYTHDGGGGNRRGQAQGGGSAATKVIRVI